MAITLMILLTQTALAQTYTITITGEPKTSDNKIDYITEASVVDSTGRVESEVEIDNLKGKFTIKDFTFEPEGQVTVGVSGSCFNHMFFIKRNNDQFEVRDSYNPDKMIMVTKDTEINLGKIVEDKSNQLVIDSDVPITQKITDQNGEWIAQNTAYRKLTGSKDSLRPRTKYVVTMEDEEGNTWKQEFKTGNYCEGIRIIKTRDKFEIQNNLPNNGFAPIGFWSRLWSYLTSFF